MILAGDIGGTKTVLALIERDEEGLVISREDTYPSGEFASFDALLDVFLPDRQDITSACFGIAGPVLNQCCVTTNLPWQMDGKALQARLGTPRVRLLNDLEAMALGMLQLDASDILELNPDADPQPGNMAVIAAGTGLGEALLYWDGTQHHAVATEGGHADLAARSPQQDALITYLRQRYPDHVSCERIVSGNGFSLLYDFLVDSGTVPPCPAVPSRASAAGVDRNAVISRLGVSDEDAACREAVRLFVEIYAAEAGNLALKTLSVGGVYIGGGIGPKIRPMLETGAFMQAFAAKGRFRSLLARMPVRLALNPRTPLLGAIHYRHC
ncbi:MAG: glucokinase [Methylococcaceae bacterium]|jgi:glucokinase